jgi:uncharacterized protein YkwD
MPIGRKRKKRSSSPPVRHRQPPRESSAVAGQPTPVLRTGLLTTVIGSSDHQAAREDAIVALVNIERKRAGLPALRTDPLLRQAARAHSKDMARRDFCAHVNPDGTTPVERMRMAGYPQPGGENVARGQVTAREVMRAWMASPGHRENVLSPTFAVVGVGAYFGPGGPCWTQNFGY